MIKTLLKLFSYSLIGFGICVLAYFVLNLGLWVVPLLTNQASSSYSLSVLLNSENLTSDLLGFASEKKPMLARKHFSVSVPSVGVEEAKVTSNVNSNKKDVYFPVLKESIAHFEGTALPGEDGNIFLYGHSVLPQFFDPNNYLTIFSKLHELNLGDDVEIKSIEGTKRYLVFNKLIVDPNQLEYLSPYPFNTVTLMTCVPPGLTSKRLLVIAREVD